MLEAKSRPHENRNRLSPSPVGSQIDAPEVHCHNDRRASIDSAFRLGNVCPERAIALESDFDEIGTVAASVVHERILAPWPLGASAAMALRLAQAEGATAVDDQDLPRNTSSRGIGKKRHGVCYGVGFGEASARIGGRNLC